MVINIHQAPPVNIPGLKWRYTLGSLFFLALVAGAVILGVVSVVFSTGKDEVLQNAAFGIFVLAGFAFVYFTEKLLGFRKLSPQQEEKLVALAQEYEEVSEYWRKVAEQGRYIVVLEYDAIEAHVQKITGKK